MIINNEMMYFASFFRTRLILFSTLIKVFFLLIGNISTNKHCAREIYVPEYTKT